jgi:hypothetical protein
MSDYEMLQQYEAELAGSTTTNTETTTELSDYELLQQYEREQQAGGNTDNNTSSSTATNNADEVYDPDVIAKPVVRALKRAYQPLERDDDATTTTTTTSNYTTQQQAELLEGSEVARAAGLDPTIGAASGWTSVPLERSFAVVHAAPSDEPAPPPRKRHIDDDDDDDARDDGDDDDDANDRSSFLPARLASSTTTTTTSATTTTTTTTTTSSDAEPVAHFRVQIKNEKKAPVSLSLVGDATDDADIKPIVFKKRKAKGTKRKKLLED